ncbi:MAG: rhomboid family intramembrane serine protease [Gemmatimonadota bacterium]
MLPIRDENPTELHPIVTFAFIAANVLIWILVEQMGQGADFVRSLCEYGAIPAEITGSVQPGTSVSLGEGASCVTGGLGRETLVTSMFMHGSWAHLLGNMWFLWVFGNNIEDSMGHFRFPIFYILTGLLASLSHIMADPASVVPTVGASGAISGVMGAYMVLYPKVRVHTLILLGFYARIVPMPAWSILLLWLVIQVASGLVSSGVGGGVAFWAHAGGFVAGAVLVKLFQKGTLVQAKRSGHVLSREERSFFDRW